MALCGAQLMRRCASQRFRPRLQLLHRAWNSTTVQSPLIHSTAASAPATNEGSEGSESAAFRKYTEEYTNHFCFPQPSTGNDFKLGSQVTVHGFLGKRRDTSSKASFVNLSLPGLSQSVEVESRWEVQDSPEHHTHGSLKSVRANSAVSVTGVVARIDKRDNQRRDNSTGPFPGQARDIQIRLTAIQVLSPFPRDIIVSDGVVFPPTSRHLQLRFSEVLQKRLEFRSNVGLVLRKHMVDTGFTDIETPLLFKSTPEGAREFLVPTRRRGLAYALPQSPQQFKQMLMAGGLRGYFQLARCFRDEDLRADRQPEFTQLDFEMAFATGETAMETVESLIRHLFHQLSSEYVRELIDGELVPTHGASSGRNRRNQQEAKAFPLLEEGPLPRISYDEAMALYGSDKPDLRIPSIIRRIDPVLPRDFVEKITSLPEPAIDACRFRLEGSPQENWDFVRKLWSTLPTSIAKNPDGAPAVMLFDSSKPLGGLSSLGHDAVANLTSGAPAFDGLAPFEDGDILIIQARQNKPFEGGSTALGALRTELYRQAVKQNLLPLDDRFLFLWVTGFPMFTANTDAAADPGQGGKAGFSATHHPFTAPLTPEDFALLGTDPLKAKADHYDLVVNGVELGGGSRRIHIAHIQDFVMREVLKMSDEGISQFSHLLDALRAGCPPHAGFALGFDRLIAVLTGTNSVRDVIAFPKSMKGEDLSVKSPGEITPEQLETYHLALRGKMSKS